MDETIEVARIERALGDKAAVRGHAENRRKVKSCTASGAPSPTLGRLSSASTIRFVVGNLDHGSPD